MLFQKERLVAVERQQLELSSPQLPIWLELQTFADPASFQIGGYVRMAAAIDLRLGRQAVELVTARHDALRLRIDERQPRQWVEPSPQVGLAFLDLSREADPEATFHAHAEAAFRTPLALDGGPLVRITLVAVGDRMSFLLVRCHHLVVDGVSVVLLMRRLLETYGALVGHRPTELAPSSSFLDFVAEDAAYRRSAAYREDLAHWRQRLADLPGPIIMPRPGAGGREPGAVAPVRSRVASDVHERFLAACRGAGLRPVQVLLALLGVLLHHLTEETDLTVGVPMAGRSKARLETLGMFVGILPLRLALDVRATLAENARRVGAALERDYRHQRVPINEISRVLGLARSGRRAPFEVSLSYLPKELVGDQMAFEGVPVEMALLTGPEPNPLAIYVRDAALEFAFNPIYLTRDEVVRLQRRFVLLLERFAADPATRVCHIDLLEAEERQQILAAWNATAAPVEREAVLAELFERQAKRAPEAPAVIVGEHRLDYGELNAAANRLAHRLIAAGAGPGSLVGISLERSPEMIVALLAVLKSGAAYLPLDPAYPPERLAFMIEDSGVPLVVTTGALSGALPAGVARLCLDDGAEAAAIAALPASNPGDGERLRALRARDLAYVIYTSGSTGWPKGVAIEQQGVVASTAARQAYYGAGATRLLLLSSISFDSSVAVLFHALLGGGTLVMPELGSQHGTALDPNVVRKAIDDHAVELMLCVPSLYAELLGGDRAGSLGSLRHVIVAGEACPVDLVARHRVRLPQATLHNEYGPTEGTVWCSVQSYPAGTDAGEESSIPIGRPIANVQLYVLDRRLAPVPVGVAGELHIGGAGVARGYLGRPGLTAERFAADPFGPPGGRLYRTGDRARWRSDGRLEFLGRADTQIKLRGVRIEAGEVEAALRAHPAVSAAAVMVREDRPGDRRLVAYLVRAPEPPKAALEKRMARWRERLEADVEGGPGELPGWAAWAAAEVRRLAPQRVVEIGCGSGELLQVLAPGRERYLATEISAKALDRLRGRIAAGGPALAGVELALRAADDFRGIAPGSFDAAILGEGLGSFADIKHLMRVIEGALGALRPGGFLVLAEVRSLALLRAAHAAAALAGAAGDLGLDNLKEWMDRGVSEESELCLDPGLFPALRDRFKGIGEVRFGFPAGSIDDQRSRFCCGVVLHLGTAAAPPKVVPIDGRRLDLMGLREVLESAGERSCVTGLVNARVAAAQRAASLIGDGQLGDAAALRRTLAGLPGGVDPGAVTALGEALGMRVELAFSVSRGDCFDAAFTRRGVAGPAALPPLALAKAAARRPWRSYANQPHLPADDPPDPGELRAHLAGRLLPAMIPAGFVWLDALPLSPNGKLDRKALPAVEAAVARAPYAAPRSDVEALCCRIMQEVVSHDRLDLARVGIDDHFFDIGGHSILAVHFAGRLEQALGRSVPVRLIFEAPTVRELAARLEQETAASDVPAVTLVDRSSPIPASLEQERMWVLNELLGDRPVYNEGIPLVLRGRVDTRALVRTVQDLLDRYEVLRTRIVRNAQGLWQSIDPPGAVRVVFEDWSGRDEPELWARAGARATALLAARYDLAREPPCRALVIKLSDDAHLWCLATHHIAGDNWSLSHVLPGDFAALYRAHAAGLASRLPEMRLHYADYAAWQRSPAMAARREAQLGYWRSELAGAPAALDLPSDRARPVLRDYAGARVVAARLTSAEWRAVERFAVRHGATPFMVFEAALACLLYRVTGSDDVVIGTPHMVRPHADLWAEYGYFGNTLALRTRLEGGEPFAAVFDRVRQTTLGAFQHQDVPFAAVVEALGLRPRNHTPLFQVLLVMHAYLDTRAFETDAFRIEQLGDPPSIAKFDLTIDVNPGPSGVSIDIEYARDMFDEATVLRFGSIYRRLLLAVLAAPETAVGALPMMEEAERSLVVDRFNATAAEYPRDKTVVDLFEARAAAAPGALAVINGARSVAFGALASGSRRLARHLIEMGVGPEVVVGVCVDRSAELILALLGVLQAGGAYLPLDPEYPEERLGFMLKDAGVPILVTSAAHAGRLTGVTSGAGETRLIVIDGEATQSAIAAQSDGPIANGERRAALTPANLAYVIYTSGSTGKPKGVAVEHRSVVTSTAARLSYYGSAAARRLLLLSSIAFDSSVATLFHGLLGGQTLVIPELGSAAIDLAIVRKTIAEQAVDLMLWVPSLYAELLGSAEPQALGSLRHVIVAGEACSADLVARHRARLPQAALHNEYGPTEGTVWCSVQSYPPGTDAGEESSIPIGRPIANTRLYVLDRHLAPVPVGVAGELHIGGAGVARGYLGRPGLTAERFVADPFSGEAGSRLYRTGDLARWRSDGRMEYLGRIDHQVKIRGMRVELGEIETALQSLPGIRHGVVVARGSAEGEARLIAYVVPSSLVPHAEPEGDHSLVVPLDGLVDIEAVRLSLKQVLPEHMVPSGYVGLRRLPLTPSGKIDRKGLPDVEAAVARAPYAAPRSDVEALCCRLMQEVVSHDRLDLARVGIDDHFFDIGGHSILAVHFAGRLEQALGRSVPVRLVFEAPTVRELAARLEQETAASDVPPVTLADRSLPIPASLEQERMWVLNELLGDRPVYNEGIPLLLRGRVDTGALVRTVQDLLDRYEVLRTRIVRNAQGLWQEIDPPGAVRVVFEDWSGRDEPEADLRARAGARATALLAAPYDLAREPPCRALVIKLSDEAHLWCLATHHIAGDNWSLSHVLPGDFAAFYRAHIAGLPPRLPEIRLHYADYAAWQRSAAMAARREAQLGYWRSELTGAPAALDLPSDRARPVLRDYAGARVVAARLTSAEWRAVERFAVRHGATPFMVFEAALACLLYRVTGSDDVVIGTPHTVKPHADLWPEFGYFGNTLALRTRLEGGEPFAAVFDRVRQTTLGAFQHQDVPFEAVVEALGLRPRNHTPLFQVLLVMHAYLDTRAFETEAFRIEQLGDPPSIAKFDLTIDVNPGPSGVSIDIEYARDMFDEATVLRFGSIYRRLLLAVLAAPETAVGALPMMEEAERSLVVDRFNATAAEYPRDKTVVDLFEAQAADHPEAVAVADGARALTYGELDRASNRLARHLMAMGVGPEVVVGVCLGRSAELILTLLGIWKAGGAYLPLDPDYPEDRLGFMLRDAGAPILVTRAAHAARLAGVTSGAADTRLVVLDEEATAAAIAARSEGPIGDREHQVRLTPARLAYVIYTSGSTGKPKGVMVGHEGLGNYAAFAERAFAGPAPEVVLHRTTIGFDYSAEELWWPLAYGHQVVIAGEAIEGDPEGLRLVCERAGVTTLVLVPSLLRALLEGSALQRMPRLRQVLCGGEALSVELLRLHQEQLSGVRLVNHYGPTEATINATSRVCREQEQGAAGWVSIGAPVSNTRIYVVDTRFEPQPVGVAGELVIGGVQVARGYLGRPGLTAEKFVADPFSGEAGSRIYRTGDLARWRPDGTVEFLGRLDHQVKIRGMRVELGEIEAALQALPGIGQSVVVARRDGEGDARLIAYVVPNAGAASDDEAGTGYGSGTAIPSLDGLIDIEAVKAALKRVLPEHMVPSGYVGLWRLPLTASGKIDRKALPDVEAAVARAAYVAPRSEAELQVAATFAELLDVERVGVHDSFFDLGGHSLLAARLVSRLAEATGKSLLIRAAFEHPTVEALARALGALGRGELAAITPVERSGFLPLSYQQERLWFLQQLDGAAGAAYNVVGAVRLAGALDVGALKASVAGLVERHESLRTRFAVAGGRPGQVIDGAGGFALVEEDAGSLSAAALEARVGALVRAPFDLERGPLFRAHLLRVSAREHVLVLGGHHTVLDGWSVGLLLREASVLYRAHRRGEAMRLPALGIQYADYAHWQRAQLSGAELERQAAYWREALAGAPAAITLPFDRPRPAEMDYRGGSVSVVVPAEVTAALKGLARVRGATLFMVLQAAFAVLLSRLGGDRDVVIGTAVAGRGRVELEPIAGFFVNTLALRHRIDDGESFGALLDRTKGVILSAFEHQEVPFEAVVEAVRPERSLSHAPLLQTMLVLQNHGEGLGRWLALPDVEVSEFATEEETAQFELSLDLSETALGLSGSLSYRRALFDRESAERIAARFKLVLAGIAEAPDRTVGSLPLMDRAERLLVVDRFNATAHEYPRDKTVVDLFEAQAAKAPSAVAVVDGAREIDYMSLAAASRRLGRHLIGMGVGPDTVVGVCLDRSAELIVSLFGILQAGGAYLPLDAEYPDERLAFMLMDAGARVLVTSAAHAGRLAAVVSGGASAARLVVIDEEASAIAALPGDPIGNGERRAPLTPANLAYVIYTSGSTGKPKGVMVGHEGLTNRLLWAPKTGPLEPGDAILQKTPAIFDTSVTEFFWWAVTGARVAILPAGAHRDPGAIAEAITHYGVTSVDFVPSQLDGYLTLVTADPKILARSRLRRIYVGGEALSATTVTSFHAASARSGRSIALINLYGPTETIVEATFYETRGDETVVPIGAPLPNMAVYVVDEQLDPQPLGVAGELVIGGAQVARGYLGRPGLTAEKFVADPFSGKAGSRLYRTGDLARWRADGTVEYLGRVDHQVKIRGMRIELGEIEAALKSLPGIAQSAVVARRDGDRDARLVAYVVPGGLEPRQGVAGDETGEVDRSRDMVVPLDRFIDVDAVRAALKRVLPAHMVPSSYVGLRRFPLTASGKLDRKALPNVEGSVARARYVAPSSKAEVEVAAALAELLGVEQVGIDDNFFDLGGHSLLAVQFVSRLRERLGVEVPLRTLFEAPTVAGLATRLGEAKASLPLIAEPRPAVLPLSYRQDHMWRNQQLKNDAYWNCPFAVRLNGSVDPDLLFAAINAVVERHEVLRTRYPSPAGEPFQEIRPASEVVVWREDLSGLQPAEREAALNDQLAAIAIWRFDLGREIPLRFVLIRLAEQEHVLAGVVHHIAFDGWSARVLLQDFAASYLAASAGETPKLPPLALQYADFALWQRRLIADPAGPVPGEIAFWREMLAGLPALMPLPTDQPRVLRLTRRGETLTLVRPRAAYRAIIALAHRYGVTLFTVLHAAMILLLARWSGTNDILIGTPTARRDRREIEGMIGDVEDRTLLRTRLAGDPSLADFLTELRDADVAVFNHQVMPYRRLIAELLPERADNADGVMQVLLNLIEMSVPSGFLPGISLAPLPLDRRAANYELEFTCEEDPDGGLSITLIYDRDLFLGKTAVRLMRGFERILTEMGADTIARLSALQISSAGDETGRMPRGSKH